MAITGIGMSDVSRGAAKSALRLTIDACLEAIRDAGLERKDIDGISSYPGADNNGSGFSPVGVYTLLDAMRLHPNWYSGGIEVPGQFGAVFNAVGAISAGLARHVLVFRTVYEASARKGGTFANRLFRNERASGLLMNFAPYNVMAAATQHALYFQRYVHQYGIKPEQVAQIAINGRRNAALNPKAVYRTPITLEEYLASPIISTPLRLYDCDVPCDGSVAVILSHRDAAKDLRNPPLRLDSVGSALHYRAARDQIEALAEQALPMAAKMMWSRSDYTPADVDVAQMYDGFTYHTLAMLEGMGFCGRGEAGDFLEGGHRIALDGELPMNTGGGQLSAGRLHAYGLLHEACVQLWGRGDERQVAGNPKVAAAATAGGTLGGCLILARDGPME